MPGRDRARRPRWSRPGAGALAFAGYLALSLAMFGPGVLGGLDSRLLAANDVDASAYVWFLAWWPHALLHGLDPIQTHAIFAGHGYNLAWATAIPGPSLVLAPLTLTAGPVVSYNLLSLLAPAVSAWTAFLLCRHVSGAVAPSLVGGYLFGFSSFVLGALQGAPNLALAALVPVAVLLVVRRVEGTISARGFVLALTATLTAQFLVSTELLATLSVFGAGALVVAFLTMVQRRPALRRALAGIAVAYAATAVLVTPFLVYMFGRAGTRPLHAMPERYSADLASLFFPGGLQRLGRHRFAALAATFGGGGGPGGDGYAYLGLALVAIVALFAAQRWRTDSGRLLVVAFAGLAIAALGPRLHVAGIRTVWLPWEPFTHLPLMRYALPVRFAALLTLVTGVIVALWLARRPSLGRWALAAVAVALLVPDLGSARWKTPAPTPAFFRDDRWRAELGDHARVLLVPPIGAGMRWQAIAGMGFDSAVGYAGRIPDSYVRDPGFAAIATAQAPPGARQSVRRFVLAHRVDAVVVGARVPGPWPQLFGGLGPAPRAVNGVVVYRVARGMDTSGP